MNSLLLSRRQALKSLACGFGYLALADLASATNPLAPRPPHHPARAKRAIFLFMQGGPSHVDTFDYKPRLARDDGRMLNFADARPLARTMEGGQHRVLQAQWRFRPYGQSGRRALD